MNEEPVGKKHEPPEKLELASECTPQHPILPGGMQALWRQVIGETSQERDNRVLAQESYQAGNYEEARRLYKHVLNQALREFGPDHLETAIAMNDLANVYAKQHKFKQATDLYQRALPIYSREFGWQSDSKTHEVKAKLRLGQKLGSYNLISYLGKGAFAYVYLGRYDRPSTQGQDHQLPTLAAVKVLQMNLLDERDIDHFNHEAGILASLQHEHVVRVYEFGTRG